MTPEAAVLAPTERSPAEAFRLDAVEQAIVALTRVWSVHDLYPADHPIVDDALNGCRELIETALRDDPSLTVKFVHGHAVCDDVRLFTSRRSPSGLIGALNQQGIECITLMSGLDIGELLSLVRSLATPGEGIEAIHAQLADDSVRHIAVDRLASAGFAGAPGTMGTSLPVAELYNSAMAIVRQAMHSVRVARPVDVRGTSMLSDELVASITKDPSAAIGLACLKGHDDYTFAHSVHTALLSLSLGEAIGLSEPELKELGMAGILHDVGKIRVPLEVLRKPGKLSDDEWAAIQRHPAEGAAVLLDRGDLPDIVPVVALEHHLHYDSGGYPSMRHRRELSLYSLVVGLADVYDALTTHRPYRPPLPPDEAIGIMGDMVGTQLHPRLVDWFREMLGPYPPGSCVGLDTGEVAVVCRANPSTGERPEVCVALDADGVPVPDLRSVDLMETSVSGAYSRSVVATPDAKTLGVDTGQVLDRWLNDKFGGVVDESSTDA